MSVSGHRRFASADSNCECTVASSPKPRTTGTATGSTSPRAPGGKAPSPPPTSDGWHSRMLQRTRRAPLMPGVCWALLMGSKSTILKMSGVWETRSRLGCQRSPGSSGSSSACSLSLRRHTIELIGGSLPGRQRRLAEAWAEIHQAELLAAWASLQAGRPPGKIEPLRRQPSCSASRRTSAPSMSDRFSDCLHGASARLQLRRVTISTTF